MYAVSITVPITMDGVAMTTLVWKGNNVERSVHVVGLNPILTEVIDGWIGACVQCLLPSTLPKCQGCLEDQPNQMTHIGPNGCLGEELYE
jgi:hypothetical protein